MPRNAHRIAHIMALAAVIAFASQAAAQRGGGAGGARAGTHAGGGAGGARGGTHHSTANRSGTHHSTTNRSGNVSRNANVNRNTNVNVNRNVNVNHNVNWTGARVAARPYAWPHGYAYGRRAVGYIMPRPFLTSAYYYSGWAALGLTAPMAGYQWVRYGSDLLLVEIGTGRVADARYGVFQ